MQNSASNLTTRDLSRCPQCGGPNKCCMAKEGVNKVDLKCWCMDLISPSVAASAVADETTRTERLVTDNLACYCEPCLKALRGKSE